MTAEFYDDDFDGEHETDRQEYAYECWKADKIDIMVKQWEPSAEQTAWLEAQKQRLIAVLGGKK